MIVSPFLRKGRMLSMMLQEIRELMEQQIMRDRQGQLAMQMEILQQQNLKRQRSQTKRKQIIRKIQTRIQTKTIIKRTTKDNGNMK